MHTKGTVKPEEVMKFIIMDFEFAPYQKQDIVLVSGAISGALEEDWNYKLEGVPLLMDDNVREINRDELKRVKSNIKRIFKDKKERYLQPIQNQIDQSLKSKNKTLDTGFIEKHIYFDSIESTIIVWNGQMDMKILEKLKIYVRVLNISAYGDLSNYFALELKDMRTNVTIHSEDLGFVDKNGRLLNLAETHNLLCRNKHGSNSHDPVHDVIQTRCIFNFIVERMGYTELINKLQTYPN